MSRLIQFYKLRFNFIVGAVVAALLWLAWHNRFIQDDAFISFRYADNLTRGLGLVWNPGEHIEGYTNFLWTIMMSGVISARLDPIVSSQVIGMIFFFVSLLFTFKLSKLIFQSGDLALLTIIFLGTNFTYSCYATGGLETQMQTALVVTSAYLCIRNMLAGEWNSSSLLAISALFTCAIFTRLDSAIFVVLLGGAALVAIWKGSRLAREKVFNAAMLILPVTVCVTCWFIWKLSYYGDILPNTFYVKASSLSSVLKGLNYFYTFFVSYLLFPFPFIGLFGARHFLKRRDFILFLLLFLTLAWVGYVVKVGGDFMEFRFMVPVLPFTFILITSLLFQYIRRPIVRSVLMIMILGGSLYHVLTFSYSYEDNIEPVSQLSGHLFNENENWLAIGKKLGEVFHDNPEVSIAVTAAGAIPFYSRLTTIDMLGLNDRWVAEHGEVLGSRAGHQRIAPLHYLIERKVNLVMSIPLVLENSASATWFAMPPAMPSDTLTAAQFVEIPFDSLHKVVVLYLHPYHVVDEAIERYHWKTHPVTHR